MKKPRQGKVPAVSHRRALGKGHLWKQSQGGGDGPSFQKEGWALCGPTLFYREKVPGRPRALKKKGKRRDMLLDPEKETIYPAERGKTIQEDPPSVSGERGDTKKRKKMRERRLTTHRRREKFTGKRLFGGKREEGVFTVSRSTIFPPRGKCKIHIGPLLGGSVYFSRRSSS